MKGYITKSKAGWYKVTVWHNDVRIYRSQMWSHIEQARADLRRFKESVLASGDIT